MTIKAFIEEAETDIQFDFRRDPKNWQKIYAALEAIKAKIENDFVHQNQCPAHPAPPTPSGAEANLQTYDAGLLSDYGGGNVAWWQDYIRAELARAYDFYQSQVENTNARV